MSDESFDFIYVDARYDYPGVKEDLETWWPKLKQGGIMAGDDYLTAKEQLHIKGDKYVCVCMCLYVCVCVFVMCVCV